MTQGGKRAGYEYLLAYKITVPIYDLTVEFCGQHIDKFSRTRDQMIQAARSGMQNLLEGNQQQGKKGYIKLFGVARGSLEELLKDYHAYARQHKIEIWDKAKCGREIREIEETWDIVKQNPTLPDNPDFPVLPKDPAKAVNLMITLINQACYLNDKLTESILKKHREEGGLTEQLYRDRMNYRGY